MADTNLHKSYQTMASVKSIALLMIEKHKKLKLKSSHNHDVLQSQLRHTAITNVNFILQPTVD